MCLCQTTSVLRVHKMADMEVEAKVPFSLVVHVLSVVLCPGIFRLLLCMNALDCYHFWNEKLDYMHYYFSVCHGKYRPSSCDDGVIRHGFQRCILIFYVKNKIVPVTKVWAAINARLSAFLTTIGLMEPLILASDPQTVVVSICRYESIYICRRNKRNISILLSIITDFPCWSQL